MAPRKQFSPRSTRKSAVVVKYQGKTSKVAKKEPEQTGLRRSRRLAEEPTEERRRTHKSTPAIFLENGLVSMEKTPKHLVPIVQRNVKKSPFLRLPGELRNTIWALVMSGHRIKLIRSDLSNPSTLLFSAHLPVFHIPEVCRQIYAETAILIYKLNTFVLYSAPARTVIWSRSMLPAQRSAITSITVDLKFLFRYIKELRGQSFQGLFPNLKKIEVLNQFSTPWKKQNFSKAWFYGTNYRPQGTAFQQLKRISGESIDIVFARA